MKIIYLPSARQDFIDLIRFTPTASRRKKIRAKLQTSIEKLATNTHLGKALDGKIFQSRGYRYLIIEKYIILYIISEDEIEINRILHGSRDYKNLIE